MSRYVKLRIVTTLIGVDAAIGLFTLVNVVLWPGLLDRAALWVQIMIGLVAGWSVGWLSRRIADRYGRKTPGATG